MPSVSFPTAIKKTYYEIEGKPYVKLGQREAVDKPDTIRAMLDDKLCWFAPENPLPAAPVSNAKLAS